MKKIHAAALPVLLALVLASACAAPAPDVTPEPRSIQASQLFDGEAGQFLLEGCLPGDARDVVESDPDFQPEETVLFENYKAEIRYVYDRDLLTGVAYALDTQGWDAPRWATAAAEIGTLLQGEFGQLDVYSEGEPGGQAGGLRAWYAGAPGERTMLVVLSAPPAEDAPGILEVRIASDIPENQAVSDSYLERLRPADDEMVRVADWIPGIRVELKYATTDNFTGQVIYGFTDAWLRFGTVEKLMRVQEALKEQGLGLIIYDAFRPVSAQFRLWDVVPDPVFVANPYKGYSTHSRGNTVDLALVTLDGQPLEMPTPFDSFSPEADHDYRDVSAEAARNATLLEKAMFAEGFKTNPYEWWHYYDSVSYPVAKDFEPGE